MTAAREPAARSRCYFCGGSITGDQKSEEDYWPRWLWKHPNFVHTVERKRMEPHGFSTRADLVANVTHISTQNSMKKRTRAHDKALGFCRTCNNGWMSAIQRDASSRLNSAFFHGTGVLDREDQDLLARWLMMTALVIDSHLSPGPLIEQLHRSRFFESLEMPPNAAVLICAFAGTEDNARCGRMGVRGENSFTGVTFAGGTMIGLAVGNICAFVSVDIDLPVNVVRHLERRGFQWSYPRLFPNIDLARYPAQQDGIIDELLMLTTHVCNWRAFGGSGLDEYLSAADASLNC